MSRSSLAIILSELCQSPTGALLLLQRIVGILRLYRREELVHVVAAGVGRNRCGECWAGEEPVGAQFLAGPDALRKDAQAPAGGLERAPRGDVRGEKGHDWVDNYQTRLDDRHGGPE